MHQVNKVVLIVAGVMSIIPAHAQIGRGAQDWMTARNDPQRTGWVRADPKIAVDNMQKPEFRFLWKVKLSNGSSGPLTSAILLDRYIGYRGFRTFGFLGAGSKDVYAVDTDLARIEWHKQFAPALPQQGASPGCSDNILAVTRATMPALPTVGGGGFFGFGRAGPAHGAVGEPDQGAVTLTQVAAMSARPAPPMPPPARRRPAVPDLGGFGFGRTLLYVLTADGKFHSMYVSNGEEPKPPVSFLPANANAQDVIVVEDAVYATTAHGCGGVPNGVWSLDLGSNEVTSWEAKGGVAGSGGPAFGPDGVVYVTTGDGELSVLEPKTLKVRDSYSAGTAFTSSPVVFPYKEQLLVAAATKDGRIHVLDTKSLHTALYKTPVYSPAGDFVAGALATWQDPAGTRWLLAPTARPLHSDTKFPTTNGSVTHGAVLAWKVVEHDGALTLAPAWASRDMASPIAPMVVNNVVFAASSGAQGSPAVLYALDGFTGKALWNSGNTIASSVHGGGLSAGGSQVYLGTSDGTLYAFGFYIEH